MRPVAKNSGGLLLNNLQDKYDIKNDAKMSHDLHIAPPVFSKIRSGDLKVGATFILRLHEVYGEPVKLIREVLALEV